MCRPSGTPPAGPLCSTQAPAGGCESVSFPPHPAWPEVSAGAEASRRDSVPHSPHRRLAHWGDLLGGRSPQVHPPSPPRSLLLTDVPFSGDTVPSATHLRCVWQ